MKKLLAIILAMLILISMAGCSVKTENDLTEASTSEITAGMSESTEGSTSEITVGTLETTKGFELEPTKGFELESTKGSSLEPTKGSQSKPTAAKVESTTLAEETEEFTDPNFHEGSGDVIGEGLLHQDRCIIIGTHHIDLTDLEGEKKDILNIEVEVHIADFDESKDSLKVRIMGSDFVRSNLQQEGTDTDWMGNHGTVHVSGGKFTVEAEYALAKRNVKVICSGTVIP